MTHDDAADTNSFVLPAQTLRGSRDEVLATIDQAIVGLLALRHLVSGELLVMPGVSGPRPVSHDRGEVPTSMAQVGKIFSNLMSRH